MKKLNAHFLNTRLGVSEIKIICIGLLFFAISSCNKPAKEDLLLNIPAYRTDVSQAQIMNETAITSNTELKDRVNGVDYIINNDLQVTAQLTIQPGVTIMFEEGAGITVKDDGALTAIGDAGNDMIYFLSRPGKRGSWKGITILNNNAQNIIVYCRIEHGGGDNPYGKANLVIGDNMHHATAQVHNNDIRTSDGTGLLLAEGSTLTWFANNDFYTNTGYPVSTHITNAKVFGDGNKFSGNGKEYIELTGSGNNLIQSPITIPNIKEPFALSGQIRMGDKLTIDAGARLNMNENARVTIDGETGNGSLTAIGTSSQPILIQGTFSTSGLWSGIDFISSSSQLNQLEYCTVSGGGEGNDGMINFKGSKNNSITMRNCTIANSATNGIYMKKNSTVYNSDIETANIFQNNAGVNIFYDQSGTPIETH